MTSELISLPMRLGLRAAGLVVRGGLQAAERALSVASLVVKAASSGGSPTEPAAYTPAAEERAQARPTRDGHPTSRRPAPREAAAAAPPPPPEPAHISEEPTLVEEFAEAGAEDGAGAQVNIAEPWDGYAHMNAHDVIARASDADAAELAAVALYEAAHRSRKKIMAVVERELRAKSGRGAATADQTRKEHANGK